jgi:two-component system KDP operon response regulator KdpE
MSHGSASLERGVPAEELPILVVDDDPQLRYVIRLTLEDAGLAVETAADAHQALAQASRSRPRLVILDMGLPRLDGAALAKELRAIHGENLPLLVISADGNVIEKARRVGAHGYLAKPFELTALSAAVQRVLGGTSMSSGQT